MRRSGWHSELTLAGIASTLRGGAAQDAMATRFAHFCRLHFMGESAPISIQVTAWSSSRVFDEEFTLLVARARVGEGKRVRVDELRGENPTIETVS